MKALISFAVFIASWSFGCFLVDKLVSAFPGCFLTSTPFVMMFGYFFAKVALYFGGK
jgi:hypothetical protein